MFGRWNAEYFILRHYFLLKLIVQRVDYIILYCGFRQNENREKI